MCISNQLHKKEVGRLLEKEFRLGKYPQSIKLVRMFKLTHD